MKIRPIYDVAVEVKTEEELQEQESKKQEKKRDEFRRFVEELNERRIKKEITAEEYRKLRKEYRKSQ